jgi:hypothetical protein
MMIYPPLADIFPVESCSAKNIIFGGSRPFTCSSRASSTSTRSRDQASRINRRRLFTEGAFRQERATLSVEPARGCGDAGTAVQRAKCKEWCARHSGRARAGKELPRRGRDHRPPRGGEGRPTRRARSPPQQDLCRWSLRSLSLTLMVLQATSANTTLEGARQRSARTARSIACTAAITRKSGGVDTSGGSPIAPRSPHGESRKMPATSEGWGPRSRKTGPTGEILRLWF